MIGRGITLEMARSADIPQIIAIEKEAFPDPWQEEMLKEALSIYPGTFFVARDNGQVAGFVAGGLEDTGEEIYGHIMNLAVGKSYRRSGVGKSLVSRLELQFAIEGATGVQLEVRISNHDAQRFYRRIGYSEVFQIMSYYTNGEDALVMMKWFRFG
jgi:[ribosomal protein S18]-alanine N-acetyltransferase